MKNRAQIQQIERLQISVEGLENKISEIQVLVDSQTHGEVLTKIQQIESSKKSLEDLKSTYQKDIKSIKSKIDDLREKIGRDGKLIMKRILFVY